MQVQGNGPGGSMELHVRRKLTLIAWVRSHPSLDNIMQPADTREYVRAVPGVDPTRDNIGLGRRKAGAAPLPHSRPVFNPISRHLRRQDHVLSGEPISHR